MLNAATAASGTSRHSTAVSHSVVNSLAVPGTSAAVRAGDGRTFARIICAPITAARPASHNFGYRRCSVDMTPPDRFCSLHRETPERKRTVAVTGPVVKSHPHS
jgi:hypothetical protein